MSLLRSLENFRDALLSKYAAPTELLALQHAMSPGGAEYL
jgi:hypothetical protein